jgi:phosphoribosylformimino-5-aminoimidazole carboxamide ribotide isomerase
MIIPCIDLMDGKAVQLRQGREKVIEGQSPDEMLATFDGFPQIQVIDLDAAMGRGSNGEIVERLAERASVRAGGGVRSVARVRELVSAGAFRVIIGTAAFDSKGPNTNFLAALAESVGRGRLTIALDSKDGRIVVKGWQEPTRWTAFDVIGELEPYCSGFLCTYVDKEGMMQGTDLRWFERLRGATTHELIAAGGITTLDDAKTLTAMNIHCAIGMSIYTGRLSLEELRALNQSTVKHAGVRSNFV